MTKLEQTYLEHTRRAEFQQQLRNPSIVGTVLDTAGSPDYKAEVHAIYTACGLYPASIGREKDGLSFSSPHMFYERFTASAWKKKFNRQERSVFEQALL